MRLDKSTLIDLLQSNGHGDKVDAARQQLPDQVDTDDPGQRSILQSIGVDPQMLTGLLDKLPRRVRDQLPGGIGKILGG